MLANDNIELLRCMLTTAEHMEPNGALKVNEFLQVEGHEDIYAIGDCCNTKEGKLAFVAQLQAHLLLENLALNWSKQAMKPWRPGLFSLWLDKKQCTTVYKIN